MIIIKTIKYLFENLQDKMKKKNSRGNKYCRIAVGVNIVIKY